MRILMVSSEIAPFAKTGGLADVLGALPHELARRGHDVRLMMPLYRTITHHSSRTIPLLGNIKVHWGIGEFVGDVLRGNHPAPADVPVYFLRQEYLYGRDGLYGEHNKDYPDNDARFGFLCFAALWTLKAIDWKPDIIHLHDWQTGLIAPLLRFHPAITSDPFFSDIRTVMTIHNLAYQGIFSADLIPAAQLPWTVFSAKGMEHYGSISLLKSGIAYSHRVTTVSPTYAAEIQTAEFGAGMDGALRDRADVLDGILNGIDTNVWNPETDPLIPANYNAKDLSGKKKCRKELLQRFGLRAKSNEPVISLVSRLVDQKGFDLIYEIMPQLMGMPLRFVLLGTGAKQYEDFFRQSAEKHPDRFAAEIGYDEQLAHLIEAGADMFLMPSRFEPSGLNQLYSMRYGTPPIVRHVGGLADSVTNSDEETISNGTATGFSFLEYTPERLLNEIARAVAVYRDQPETWRAIMLNGMNRDSSWTRSAGEYEEVYRLARAPFAHAGY